jgi:cysteine desulfurase
LTERLPNNAHFSFEGVEGESLLMSLDMNGLCASMGSACTSGSLTPSHVLKAIGLSDALAFGSLRVSIGRWTTKEDIEAFLPQLKKSVEQLRR